MIYFDQISSEYFLSEADALTIATGEQVATVTISVNDRKIYSETLYSETSEGGLVINDLNSLLLPYFNFKMLSISPLSLKISHTSSVGEDVTKETKVYYNNIYYPVPDLKDGMIHLSLPEYTLQGDDGISVFAHGANFEFTFDVRTIYRDFRFKMTIEKRISISRSFVLNKIVANAKSVLGYPLRSDDILSVRLYILDNKHIDFIFDDTPHELLPKFIFINCYGAAEELTIPGLLLKKHNYNSSTEVASNKLYLSSRSDDVVYEAQTAVLTEDQMSRLRDMFYSPKLWIDDNGSYHEILLTGIKDESDYAPQALKTAQFSYRYTNLLKL